MTYSLELGEHSADKNHTSMTGGTLSIDKNVHFSEKTELYTYTLVFHKKVLETLELHKGIHTLEHLLAYVKDTGSLRSSIEETSEGKISGNALLDISPYKIGNENYGFRVTSLEQIDTNMLADAATLSLERAQEYLSSHKSVPFATPMQCGQYDFHSISEASLLAQKASIEKQDIIEEKHETPDAHIYICDLRFLKPKLQGKDDMTMFSPEFSYRISDLIEKNLGRELGSAVSLVGTFGCMTGMYLCVSSPNGDGSDIGDIHATIIQILRDNIDPSSLDASEKKQYEKLLENYREYAQK